ncbi:MAG: family 16 glycoside hydrolase [Chitinophagaceae bacterium]
MLHLNQQHIHRPRIFQTRAGLELINGKDFTGWKASETKGTWSVTSDGLFQAVGKRSHLFYEGEYLKDGFKNFELEVLVRTYKLANSVFISYSLPGNRLA